jgi:methionyl-tRNA formyltransferase
MRVAATPLRVVVLTCGSLGIEVAARLRAIPGVGTVTVVSTPYRQRRRGVLGKLRHLYRMEGVPGLLSLVRRKLISNGARPVGEVSPPADSDAASVTRHLRFNDFHDPDCLNALRVLEPDLGVVAGTYILKDSVFTVPRLGCINLHSGKAPEYRGAAPGFWELYNGESCVGLTIHRVTTRLDAGAILLQELFPLDPTARDGDPMDYLERYRREVLRPNGVRLLAEAVTSIVKDTVVERAQDPSAGRVYRTPDYRAVKELRRRVKERRSCAVN